MSDTVAAPVTILVGADPAPARTACRAVASDLAKRALDLVLTAAVLVVALPLMVLIALVTLTVQGRPVLFRQQRVGRHGETFTMLKFRTMVRDAEHRLIDLREKNERHGPLFKLSVDPRVTRVGRLLRESSLDELPQLFNVLAGSMSLVGPRPALPDEIEHFDEELLVRHQVRPGITGLWQVHSRDEDSFDNYQRLDLHYVNHRSLRMDLAVLACTPATVLARAYGLLVRRGTPRPGPVHRIITDLPDGLVLSVAPVPVERSLH